MSLKRRTFTREFKLQVIREVEAGKPPAQAAREHQIHPNLVSKWRARFTNDGDQAFTRTAPQGEAKIAELERLIGQLTIENAFLKNVLARLEARQTATR